MDEFIKRLRNFVQQDLQQSVDELEKENWSMAIVSLEKAYGRMLFLEDEELKYQILYHLMVAYCYSDSPGRFGRMEDCFQEIMHLKIVNYHLQPEVLRLRGIGLARKGRFEESIQVFLQLAQLARGRGVLQNWAYLSELYLLQYQLAAKKTLNLAKHYGFRILNECIQKPFLRKEKAWGVRQVGRIFYAERKYAEALPYFRERLDLVDEPVDRYWVYLDLAETFLAMELISRGMQYLKEAENFFRRQENRMGLGQALYLKGKYLFHEGQTWQAGNYFEESLSLFQQSEEWGRFFLTLQEMNKGAGKKQEKRLDFQGDLIWFAQSYVLEDVYFM